MTEIKIRHMNDHDKEFVLNLSERFTEFEMMKWRNPEQMKKAILRLANEAVSAKNPHENLFVAEDESGCLLGFLHMTKQIDFFTDEAQAYVSLIAVSKDAEGKGVGRLLMKKAETWAMTNGYKRVTLNVFSQNQGAIHLYNDLGYDGEIIKMVKDLE